MGRRRGPATIEGLSRVVLCNGRGVEQAPFGVPGRMTRGVAGNVVGVCCSRG